MGAGRCRAPLSTGNRPASALRCAEPCDPEGVALQGRARRDTAGSMGPTSMVTLRRAVVARVRFVFKCCHLWLSWWKVCCESGENGVLSNVKQFECREQHMKCPVHFPPRRMRGLTQMLAGDMFLPRKCSPCHFPPLQVGTPKAKCHSHPSKELICQTGPCTTHQH